MTADTTIKCKKCGRIKKVSFQECLHFGWPECHGLTMSLESTQADIEKATDNVIASQLEPIKKYYGRTSRTETNS